MSEMDAAIVTRVSTAAQAGEEHRSLEMQLELTRAFAARAGYAVGQVFEIPGESAYVDDLALRPQFRAAIEAAERGEFGVLLVYDLSRFARNQYVLHDCLRRLRRAGCRLVAAVDGVDYTNNKMLAGMRGVIDEMFSEFLSGRVKDSMTRRHAEGLPTGDLPFGYRWSLRSDGSKATNEPPVIVPEEAEAIRWAFEARYEGRMDLAAIALGLNRRGVRPRSKQCFGEFTRTGIQRILSNPFYAGRVSHKGEVRPGKHAAIIEDDYFAEHVEGRPRFAKGPRGHHLLSGLVACHYCGRGIEVSRSGSGNRYYRERRRGLSRECVGTWSGWATAEPDRLVTAMVEGVAFDGDFLGWIDAEARKRDQVSHEAEREALKRERSRLRTAWRKGHWEDDAAEYDALMADVERRLGALTVGSEVVSMTRARLRTWPEMFGALSEEWRNRVLREMVRAVRLDLFARDVWVEPSGAWAEVFRLRKEYAAGVGMVRPGGPMHRSPSGLYLPSELIGRAA